MFLLLQKVIEGLIPNSEREKKDNIYQNLNLVSKERIFRYIVIFIFILTVIFNLPFGPNHLYGIVNHTGSLFGGHYYSYIKHIDNNWYELNDSSVSLIDKSSIVNKNAYLLFYQKE